MFDNYLRLFPFILAFNADSQINQADFIAGLVMG